MAANKKDIIRQAAIEVIVDSGFHAATTDAIAARAEVSVGTIYNYFRNKEAILEHIFQVELGRRIDYLSSLPEDLPVLEKLELFLQWHFGIIAQDPATGRILLRERSNLINLPAIREYMDTMTGYLTSLVEEGMRKGQFRQSNAALTGAIMFGALEAAVRQSIMAWEKTNRPLDLITQEAAQELFLFFSRSLLE
ncbi:MAG: TetR/AcrR family transcriptional regulator [Firmicutes bacterium]|nr:TetR/AcrR family transcriptional regulator [Bacillota bacterium]